MDRVSKRKRSEIMSKIRSKSTAIERVVFILLPKKGMKKHRMGADFIYPKAKVAVRVQGCFWHRCSKHYSRPKSSTPFWDRKAASNTARDRRTKRKLVKAGWKVVDIWEHDIQQANGWFLRKINIIRRLYSSVR